MIDYQKPCLIDTKCLLVIETVLSSRTFRQSINYSRSVLSGVPRRDGIRCPQAGSGHLSTHVTVAALRCCTGRIGTCQSRRCRSITAQ